MAGTTEQDTAWVTGIVREFWASSPENALDGAGGEKAWGEPRLGFARGDDPYFETFKKAIGPFLWTPKEAFALAFPEAPLPAARLTVISYLLPQTPETLADQRRASLYPAARWARSRFFGESFNRSLRLHLAHTLVEAGIPAVAPERLPGFDYRRSRRFGLASNWSERHAAFVAGLGTFGLSDGLITEAGKAVRFGSVVAALDLPPTSRPYPDHQAWCLWYARGTCGACIGRCPAGAITAEGHDKEKCFAYIREVAAPYATAHFGTGDTPCGLCQVAIPCEGRIPSGLTSSCSSP